MTAFHTGRRRIILWFCSELIPQSKGIRSKLCYFALSLLLRNRNCLLLQATYQEKSLYLLFVLIQLTGRKISLPIDPRDAVLVWKKMRSPGLGRFIPAAVFFLSGRRAFSFGVYKKHFVQHFFGFQHKCC